MPQYILGCGRLVRSLLSRVYRCFFIFSRITLDYDASNNWGDKLTPKLVERLTGKKCQKPCFKNQNRFLVIGSILDRVDRNGIVWGAGFICKDSIPRNMPKKIHAVRGPLTRKIFLDNEIICPEVYGDPAILLPILYPKNKKKEYKVGLIPHYVDKRNGWVIEQLASYHNEAILIDIEGDIDYVIDQVCRCEYIISSSLHGLICADAYNVPGIRVVLSAEVIGGDFKFYDYRLGVGCKPHIAIEANLNQLDLFDLIPYSSVADLEDAQKNLLAACPFKIQVSWR